MKSVLRMAVMALVVLFLASSLAAGATLSSGGGQKKASRSSSRNSKSSKSARTKSGSSGKKKYARRKWQRRGQQAIKEDRAREIQAALIREHYLTGEPSGNWDERTRQAMAKYQADHGWQSKRLPDSRALIQLGLGPTHEGVLNPESLASTQPPAAAPPDSPSLSSPR